jgi:hypothetical protein
LLSFRDLDHIMIAVAQPGHVASQREVARRLGISHTALQKAQRSGRIAPELDGAWDVAKVRAQPARTADPARGLVFIKNAQVGGTTVGTNWIGYVVHHAPGPMLAVQPTTELAKRLSDNRIDLLIEETPAIREGVAPEHSRTEHPRHHDRRNDERAHRLADACARRLLRRADGVLREWRSGEHRRCDAQRGRVGCRRHPQG